MNIYGIDVTVIATAYVKANSPEEAAEKLRTAIGNGECLEAAKDDDLKQTFAFCGKPFEAMFSDDVADITLSPAMTVQPLGDDPEVDLSAEHADFAAA